MDSFVAVFDFLNSREKAVIVWGVALIVFAAIKSDGHGVSLAAVLRALVHPKLLAVFATAALYSAGLILLAEDYGLWHTTAVKETVYWFFGIAVVLAGDATTHAAPNDPSFYKRIAKRALRFTLVVEFLVSLYVFPLAAELVLVPFIAVFVIAQVVAASDARLTPAKNLIDHVLLAVGFGLMVWVAVGAITDLNGLLNRENGERFLLTPVLTLALTPLLYCCAWISRREQDNLRKRWQERAALS